MMIQLNIGTPSPLLGLHVILNHYRKKSGAVLRQRLTWGGSRKERQDDAKNAKCFLIKQT
jgi:hypothetical protein